jgi:4-hydroxybenzoate polyprenyltransferase
MNENGLNKHNSRLVDYVRLIRIQDWLKSLFVLIGLIYSTKWQTYWLSSILAAIAFCLVSSAVYIYNDIKDVEQDKLHPLKKTRPLAQGVISLYQAVGLLFGFLIASLLLSYAISLNLLVIVLAYLVVNVAYNHGLKHIPYLEVVCIASGFLLRILAGTLGIGLMTSRWLLVCGTLLSVFIALAKRKLEMKLVDNNHTRKVLAQYQLLTIDNLMVAVAIMCLLCYSIYTYKTGLTTNNTGLLLTLPFAMLGIIRFWILTNKKSNNDDPIRLLLHDRLSWINLLIFISITFYALSS